MRDDVSALAGAWLAASGPVRGVLLPALVDDGAAKQLRDAVRPALEPFFLADRGRYQTAHIDAPGFLAELASAIVGRPLRITRSRWMRLVHGDYALYKDDHRRWRGEPYELTVDLSAVATGEAEVMYSTPRGYFPVPQRPGHGALVDRSGGAQRYDRHLTHRVGDAEVFRVSLALHDRQSQ
jgi:hypothetical protein